MVYIEMPLLESVCEEVVSMYAELGQSTVWQDKARQRRPNVAGNQQAFSLADSLAKAQRFGAYNDEAGEPAMTETPVFTSLRIARLSITIVDGRLNKICE